MKRVYAITSPENGWDCLIGIVGNKTPELEKLCDKKNWMILESYGGVETAESFVNGHDYGDEGDEEEDE